MYNKQEYLLNEALSEINSSKQFYTISRLCPDCNEYELVKHLEDGINYIVVFTENAMEELELDNDDKVHNFNTLLDINVLSEKEDVSNIVVSTSTGVAFPFSDNKFCC